MLLLNVGDIYMADRQADRQASKQCAYTKEKRESSVRIMPIISQLAR